ncbi:hypothetical protein FQN54_001547 [Arachnomyces sp. PD_36]|nr:hypothetical protein FQN54_001547 [Arachnomyces sp. PD_36]
MSTNGSTSSYKRRRELKKEWYRGIKTLHLALEEAPTLHVLRESDQERLGIQVSDFSAEDDEPWHSGLGPRFFTPLPRDSLPLSPCDPSLYTSEGDKHPVVWPLPPHELRNDWMDGRELADYIAHHLRKADQQIPPMWERTSPSLAISSFGDHYFMTSLLCSLPNARRPHLIIPMISDHSADENTILRSEVLVMISYMRWKLNEVAKGNNLLVPVCPFPSSAPNQPPPSKPSYFCPTSRFLTWLTERIQVMIISITNLYKVRILQGHFDGTLRIRRSKLYDFCVDDHEEVMKFIICWLKATPHGDTTLSNTIPISDDAVHDPDEDEAGDQNTTATGTA